MKKLLFIFLLPLSLFATEQKFFLLTFPKSGTIMMMDLLKELTEKEREIVPAPLIKQKPVDLNAFSPRELEKTILGLNEGQYPFHHFLASNLYYEFHKRHKDFLPILLLRDPRDLLVVKTVEKWDELSEKLGRNASFDKRLLFVIDHPLAFGQESILEMVKKAVIWMQEDSALVLKLEDFTDEGEALTLLCERLQLKPEREEVRHLRAIIRDYFNTSRHRKAGLWKNHFKPMHEKAFMKKMGSYLLELGYEEESL
jgi:hypothetical protein